MQEKVYLRSLVHRRNASLGGSNVHVVAGVDKDEVRRGGFFQPIACVRRQTSALRSAGTSTHSINVLETKGDTYVRTFWNANATIVIIADFPRRRRGYFLATFFAIFLHRWEDRFFRFLRIFPSFSREEDFVTKFYLILLEMRETRY